MPWEGDSKRGVLAALQLLKTLKMTLELCYVSNEPHLKFLCSSLQYEAPKGKHIERVWLFA